MKTLGRIALVLLMALTGLLLLVLAGATSGAPAFLLSLTLALVPVPFLIRLVLWIDRFEPEPRKTIALTFFWGATVACFVALILNSIGEAIVGEALGGSAAEIYGGSISAPVVEESAKGFIVFGLFYWRRDEFDGVIDGIVYASMVGLGFAMTENLFYYGQGAAEEGIAGAVGTFVIRGLMSPLAHPLFTAAFGIGLGLAVTRRGGAARFLLPLAGLGTAMGLHSLWNTAAAGGQFFGVYLLVMAPALAAVVAVAVWHRRREAATIRRQLGPLVQQGVLAAADVEVVGSLRERRRQRKIAGDRRRRAALSRYAEAATELAFVRERRERGLLGGEADAREARALQAALEARSVALG